FWVQSEAHYDTLWLTGIGCLAIGICLGVIVASRMKSANPSRVAMLEETVQQLQSQHEKYREHVGQHFDMTAELVQQMTESYRDVYQHLATGAQELCSGEVANKLLPASEDVFRTGSSGTLQPPRDYAPRQHSAQN